MSEHWVKVESNKIDTKHRIQEESNGGYLSLVPCPFYLVTCSPPAPNNPLFPVNPGSFRNSYHNNYYLVIFDLVKDPIITLSESVFFLNGEFLTTMWAGVLGKTLNAVDNPLSIPLRGRSQFLHSRGFDEDLIGRHDLLDP